MFFYGISNNICNTRVKCFWKNINVAYFIIRDKVSNCKCGCKFHIFCNLCSAAFKSTLEEAKYADIIFHVVDASNMQREKQMFITYQTLDDLGVKDKKFVTLFNKQDARTDNEPLHDFRADYTLNISASKDLGLDEVKSLLEEILRENKVYIERIIPYDKAGVIQLIRKQGELVSEEYVADGIQIKAYVPMEVYGRLD